MEGPCGGHGAATLLSVLSSLAYQGNGPSVLRQTSSGADPVLTGGWRPQPSHSVLCAGYALYLHAAPLMAAIPMLQ